MYWITCSSPAQMAKPPASGTRRKKRSKTTLQSPSPCSNDGRYFFYQICKDVEFSRPSAPGNVLLENTTGNAFDM